MFTRVIIAGATIVALGAPAAQAAPACTFLAAMFSKQQCSFLFTTGNGNSSTVNQDQRGYKKGYQFAIHIQDGDNNVAYTGQKGTNDLALTVQTGDNNTAGTHQEGTNLTAVTVQTGNNGWSTIGQSGNGGTAVIVQDN